MAQTHRNNASVQEAFGLGTAFAAFFLHAWAVTLAFRKNGGRNAGSTWAAASCCGVDVASGVNTAFPEQQVPRTRAGTSPAAGGARGRCGFTGPFVQLWGHQPHREALPWRAAARTAGEVGIANLCGACGLPGEEGAFAAPASAYACMRLPLLCRGQIGPCCRPTGYAASFMALAWRKPTESCC